MPTSHFKAVKAKLFTEHTIVERTVDAVLEHGKNCEELFKKTTEYWGTGQEDFIRPHIKPDFTTKLEFVNGLEWQATVVPTGDDFGVYRWIRINNGAADRHDRLTMDFDPKTRFPGSIGTNWQGAGGYAGYSDEPRVIRPRKWAWRVMTMLKTTLPKRMQAAITKGLKNE